MTVLRFPTERTAWPPPSWTSFDGVERLDDHPMRTVELPADVEEDDA